MKTKRVVAYILIVLLVAYVISQVQTLRIWREKQKRIERLGGEMTLIEEENRALQKELLRVRSNEAEEEAIRDNLGWSKPGEQVVVVEESQMGDGGVKAEVGMSGNGDGWSEMERNVREWMEVF